MAEARQGGVVLVEQELLEGGFGGRGAGEDEVDAGGELDLMGEVGVIGYPVWDAIGLMRLGGGGEGEEGEDEPESHKSLREVSAGCEASDRFIRNFGVGGRVWS